MTTTLTLGSLELEVEFDIVPAHRGARGSCGEPLEPDSPATVDVLTVKENGVEVWVSNSQMERIEQMCLARCQ
jgi:hypothetical protein